VRRLVHRIIKDELQSFKTNINFNEMEWTYAPNLRRQSTENEQSKVHHIHITKTWWAARLAYDNT